MTFRVRRPACWLPIVMLSALNGCSATLPVDRPVTSDRLTEHLWVLRDLQGERVARSDPEAATLRFLPDHGTAGTASCNSIGGREITWSADASGNEGTFLRDTSQPTIKTVVGCNDMRATQIADRFWTLMTQAREWSIGRDDLTIRFSDGAAATLVAVKKAESPKTDCRNAPNNFDCPRSAAESFGDTR